MSGCFTLRRYNNTTVTAVEDKLSSWAPRNKDREAVTCAVETLLESRKGLGCSKPELEIRPTSSSVKFVVFPEIFEEIDDLAKLTITKVQLQVVPALESLSHLTHLNLSHNNIHVIDLSGLSRLKVVDLSHNQLTFVDFSLSPALQEVDVSHNPLRGPLSLKKAKSLTLVAMRNTGLKEIPKDLPKSVKVLDLGNNAISEIFARIQSKYPNLRVLNLSGNSLGNWKGILELNQFCTVLLKGQSKHSSFTIGQMHKFLKKQETMYLLPNIEYQIAFYPPGSRKATLMDVELSPAPEAKGPLFKKILTYSV